VARELGGVAVVSGRGDRGAGLEKRSHPVESRGSCAQSA
jgi:hypothetical protein